MKRQSPPWLPYAAGGISLMVASFTIGPCASQDYVMKANANTKAEIRQSIDAMATENRLYRSEMREELKEIRSDIKKLLRASGGHNVSP